MASTKSLAVGVTKYTALSYPTGMVMWLTTKFTGKETKSNVTQFVSSLTAEGEMVCLVSQLP
jgi:hypothetical protein